MRLDLGYELGRGAVKTMVGAMVGGSRARPRCLP